MIFCFFFFFQAEDGIRDGHVTGVQTCALPIFPDRSGSAGGGGLRSGSRAAHRPQPRPGGSGDPQRQRSEERRVGKECRSRWWPDPEKKKRIMDTRRQVEVGRVVMTNACETWI